MRVFFAGASGAIGPPVVRELIDRGHEVVAMTSSAAKVPLLADLGAEPVVADAMDADALMRAVRAARPDGVVNMMTRIPAKPCGRRSCAPPTSCASTACATCSTPRWRPARSAS